MLQIGYFSTASGPQDEKIVHDILLSARRANRRDSITGLLVAGGGRYLQVIEGPREPVEALYGRIVKDNRHLAVTQFLRRDVADRSFGDWSMAYRRHRVGQADSFSNILAGLTSEVADTGLKQKIHFFARTMMSDQSSLAPG